MAAVMLFHQDGTWLSTGTVVVNPLPAGWTTRALTDPEYAALRRGDLLWNGNALVVNPKLAEATNQTALNDRINAARTRLLEIRNEPQVATNNLAVVRGIQKAVQDVSQILLDLGRLTINKLDALD